MDPDSIVIALRKNAVLVTMHIVLGTVAGLALGLLTPATYTSSASARVGVEQSSGSQSVASVQNYITQIMPTLVEVGTSESTLAKVSEDTGLSQPELRSAISVSTKTETVIIEVSATHTDPGKAQAIAEAEMAALDSAAREVSSSGQNSDLTLTLATLNSPSLPTEPSSLSAFWTAVLGGAAGLGLGALVAILLHALNRGPQRESDGEPLIVVEHGPAAGS
ncbi:chain-length determining protein [Actinomyces bowdenii]|uniref:Chain-length determining protein n=1 Tax=Actinomyces bowdenii TaxID=131109 RepID=A0A3P1V529_9ACTO|nr:Wzz/FepE/Etk N-terminal domain-containing protein [Actinomyces bowdenii]MBO3725115.1 chain-length determining protein [Actinomyces bowdenii]RRD29334.1 chain-length determining protein [Actinomyces bowdenii]